MVRQLLLPKEGGGSLRRFLGIRQRLLADQWNDSRPLRGPISLFDFRRKDDAADLREAINPSMRGLFGGWRLSDDGVIGGYSSSRMKFHEGSNNNMELSSDDNWSSSSPPFLRWSGTLSTEINKQSRLARNITRSGFAAILSPEYPFSAPLDNHYRALEICCRTDGRTYAVNLHVETYFPEDVYQGFIVGGDQQQEMNDNSSEDEGKNSPFSEYDKKSRDDNDGWGWEEQQTLEPEQSLDVRQHLQNRKRIVMRKDPNNHPYHGHPPLGFQRLILPFRDFVLTSRGRQRQTQRDLDGSVNIESIGFTLMDGKNGDFCFDLVSLRAVNMIDGEVVGTLEDEAREDRIEKFLKSGEGGKEGDGEEGKEGDNSELNKSGTVKAI